ncbi:hypothetical protein LEN26_003971, partial [Aphanomyces euteiches]
MPTLCCLVVGEGRPFPVSFEDDEMVGTLKQKIKELNDYPFLARNLDLYSVNGLLQTGEEQFQFNQERIDMTKCSLEVFVGSTTKLVAADRMFEYPDLKDLSKGKIHVLVVVPSGTVLQSNSEGSDSPLVQQSSGVPMHKKPRIDSPLTVICTTASCFNPCDIAFYNNILGAKNQNGWLHFSDSIPASIATANKILIRSSFEKIASKIRDLGNEKYFKAIVTGTPGIGKSYFLIYLLWTLLIEGKKVIFLYHPDVIYFDGCGGVTMTNLRDMPQSNERFWHDENLWCLFDAKSKSQDNLNLLPYSRIKIVLSTSPRRDIINDFQKPPEPYTYFMPLWTEAELQLIAPSFPEVCEWKTRFVLLGGIPRSVLEKTSRKASKILDAACVECDLNDCMKVVGCDSTITPASKIMHTLIHINSIEPYTSSEVQFASQAALDKIVRHNMIMAKRFMQELLSSCDRHPFTAALCGHIFEVYAIELLEKGGTFECRQLLHKNNNKQPTQMQLNIPSSTKIVADQVSDTQLP